MEKIKIDFLEMMIEYIPRICSALEKIADKLTNNGGKNENKQK